MIRALVNPLTVFDNPEYMAEELLYKSYQTPLVSQLPVLVRIQSFQVSLSIGEGRRSRKKVAIDHSERTVSHVAHA